MNIEKPQCQLCINRQSENTTIVIESPAPMPNWWWRMWQYLLLGFEWEKL